MHRFEWDPPLGHPDLDDHLIGIALEQGFVLARQAHLHDRTVQHPMNISQGPLLVRLDLRHETAARCIRKSAK